MLSWIGPYSGDDGVAPNNLGSRYELGQGVEQNYAEAIKWYQKAITQGDKSAQVGLDTRLTQLNPVLLSLPTASGKERDLLGGGAEYVVSSRKHGNLTPGQ
ncbi:MAG: SEL1-like repeat protein [Gammaproteobacteria bacterium]|nr:SEL1-like repeat protein [Gammaproteobacteria bacterium]